jgi:hypothetical protein
VVYDSLLNLVLTFAIYFEQEFIFYYHIYSNNEK